MSFSPRWSMATACCPTAGRRNMSAFGRMIAWSPRCRCIARTTPTANLCSIFLGAGVPATRPELLPKLVVAVPYSPATGTRVLMENTQHLPALLHTAQAHARATGASSLHILFPTENEMALLEQQA